MPPYDDGPHSSRGGQERPTRRAIDFANYTAIPAPAVIAALRAAGYVRAIVGSSYGSVARAQLSSCIEGGMETEAYAWLTASTLWRPPLDRALGAIDGLPVRRLWLDYEEPALTEARLRKAIAYIKAKRPDLRVGIYTSATCWAGVRADFAQYPLWLAHYVADPDPAHAPLFGGWTSAAMWQYRGTSTVCGFVNVDISLILEDERMYSDRELDEKLLRGIAAARDAAEHAANLQIGHVLKTLGVMGERLDRIEARLAAMQVNGQS